MHGGLLCNDPVYQQAVWVEPIHQVAKLVIAAVMPPLNEIAQQLWLQLQNAGLGQPFCFPERLLCNKG